MQKYELPNTFYTPTTSQSYMPLFFSNIGKNIVAYKEKQQELQEEPKQALFISALLKGSLTDAIELELQGISFIEADSKGVFPLEAAIYGGNFAAVKYVESRLDCEELKIQWAKINVSYAKDVIQKMIPSEIKEANKLIETPEYRHYGKWAAENADKPWIETYNQKCLDLENLSNWAVSSWNRRKGGGNQKWTKCKTYNDTLLSIPSREVHDIVVKEIRNQLHDLINYVESKVAISYKNIVVFK